ncbi:hypothetical protein AVEN_130256-1 [Araneus ventricosus]|uniref:Uncharacterized protein n=1 Tax=Araneus ventricosus TaxID=182803 RepID=A0A4Y2FMI8_ARAVE|nr:hypothetical protein AVEN_130256-1 [Araneus ventricosus]
MHGYCDRSGKAYSAMVHLRIIPRKRVAEKVVIVFVAAKTGVNPIEPVTLNRIEMYSAFLLARLSSTILETLPIQINGVYLWSDSQIVSSWIHLPPKKIFGSAGPVEFTLQEFLILLIVYPKECHQKFC